MVLSDILKRIKKDISSLIDAGPKSEEDVADIKEEKIDFKTKFQQNKKVIYDNIMEVKNTDSEGRQNLIKQLIKEDEFISGEHYYQDCLICCDADLEDAVLSNGKKGINVVVTLTNNKYPSLVGQIPEDKVEELLQEIKKGEGYSVDLYVSTEDSGKHSLKVRVKYYKPDF
ncbi:MAG TPA: hypothetical protein PLI19_02615 [Erysipelotrichaceae bacterium]|nr:hypothetical protein [Erysipelotrichaceae bacterium]